MRAFLSLVLVVSCCSGAFAQSGQIPEEAKEKCKADYEKLCSGVMPGGGRILKCFQAHIDKVSPGCAEALAKIKG